MKGTIEINPEKGTVTIRLENGSYCVDHYPIGIKHFIEEEIECLKKQPKGWLIAND
jgi:hypothetical protein